MNRSRRPDEHLASGQRPAASAAKEVSQHMPVQRFAQVFGAVYLLVGLLGFTFTGFGGFAATSDDKLLLFGVNPLHNIVHLAVGALWLASSRSEASARAVSILIGAVYLVVGVLGLFINGSSDLNILNINQPDNALHFASAALGLYCGLAGRRPAVAPAA
jgi:vacuolar-type H+-ATPase subunit I/STV1